MTDEWTLRRRLVADLRRRDYLHSEPVAEAFAAVPRHLFVPGRRIKDVYTDQAFAVKQLDGVWVSSSSQPSIMAIMLEQLELQPGQRVLEIGAGSGYNAALLSRLVGEGGRVTTIDIDPEIAESAREHLQSAGCDGAAVVTADGGFGHPDGAPYDRIIATASCWQIPQAWLEQLVDGGLLVLPLRLNGAHVCLALRKEDGVLTGRRAAMCGFMPLRGAFGRVSAEVLAPDLTVGADTEFTSRTRASVRGLLQQGRRVKVRFPRRRDAINSPLYYLILQGKPVLQLVRHKKGGQSEWSFAIMNSDLSAVALSWYPPGRPRLTLFGSDEALDFLRSALERWRAEGRPDLRDLRARVWPSRAPAGGGLPRRFDGRYRFRRGDHVYELWFER